VRTTPLIDAMPTTNVTASHGSIRASATTAPTGGSTAAVSPPMMTTARAAEEVPLTSRVTRSPSAAVADREGPAARTWRVTSRRSAAVVRAVPAPVISWLTTSTATSNTTSAAVAASVPPAVDQVGAPERAAGVTSWSTARPRRAGRARDAAAPRVATRTSGTSHHPALRTDDRSRRSPDRRAW
jgi:hypothetical protein